MVDHLTGGCGPSRSRSCWSQRSLAPKSPIRSSPRACSCCCGRHRPGACCHAAAAPPVAPAARPPYLVGLGAVAGILLHWGSHPF